MSKRFRIDFVIKEVDPAGDQLIGNAQTHGISFGEEVPVEEVYDFIDRCRDASRVLFGDHKVSKLDELKKELEAIKARVSIAEAARRASTVPPCGDPGRNFPSKRWQSEDPGNVHAYDDLRWVTVQGKRYDDGR